MRYEAKVHGTVKGSDLTYVLIAYYAQDADSAPTLVEEHLMQLRDVGTRTVTNEQGFLALTDGSFLDPAKIVPGKVYAFLREQFKVDVLADIDAAAQQRWAVATAKRHTGDWTADPGKVALQDGKVVPQLGAVPIATDKSDPYGVLARPDVQAITP